MSTRFSRARITSSLNAFQLATLLLAACPLMEDTARNALRSMSSFRSISCWTASRFILAVRVFSKGSQMETKLASTASTEFGATPSLSLRNAACASILTS